MLTDKTKSRDAIASKKINQTRNRSKNCHFSENSSIKSTMRTDLPTDRAESRDAIASKKLINLIAIF